jgi:hypothetical protein
MSESIPDVILRLARRHIPVDAAMPVSPAQPASEPSHLPIDVPAPLPRGQDDAPSQSVPATEPEPRSAVDAPDYETAAASNPQTSAAAPIDAGSVDIAQVRSDKHNETPDRRPPFVVQASRLPSERRTPARQPATFPHTDEPLPSASAPESFAAERDPPHAQPRPPAPSFTAGTNPSYRSGNPPDDFADDAFEPAARSATNTGSPRDQSSLDAVGEASRQLEQTARDLETSLTRLFTTQIETLQRLRDRVDEQERRWVEQQSARRATL